MRGVVFVLAMLALGARSLAEPCPSLPDDPNCRKIFFIRNADPGETQPRNFRRTDGPFVQPCGGEGQQACPSRVGLDTFSASGSGQPTVAGYQWIKEGIARKRLVVFDLRQESHGFFAGVPVSWYRGRDQINCSKSDGQIAAEEARLLAGLRPLQSIEPLTLQKPENEALCNLADSPVKIAKGTVESEEEVIRRLGGTYHRIYVPDFHAPEDWQVDAFVEAAKGLRRNWLHFHCAAGDGRTTTFMSMYDMMQNALNVDAATILKRQYFLGGADLTDTGKVEWKKQWAIDRLAFLNLFHRYCRDQIPAGFAITFSEWKLTVR